MEIYPEVNKGEQVVALESQVAELQRENLLMLNCLKEIQLLLAINGKENAEKYNETDLQRLILKIKDLVLLQEKESEELATKRQNMQKIFELCSMAKM